MSLLAAFAFLTILPLPARWRLEERHLARATPWFSLVGLALGLALALLDGLLASLLAQPARDVLVVVVGVALTGALHLDGLMDTCDGFFAAVAPKRRLEIMRDSHVGSFGVVGAALVLLGKVAALGSLGETPRLAVLVCTPLLGRAAMSLAVVCLPAARPEGLGWLVKDAARPRDLLVSGLITLTAAGLALGPAGLVLSLVVGGLAGWAARLLSARTGGLTGDSYGAVGELAELLTLVLAPLCWRALSGLGPPTVG